MIVLAWLVERTIAVISLVRRIGEEEVVVKSLFGDEWKKWAKVVRYRLIPGIY
jgi:protein-S-isoprenylcysteine O-methyltransferase Ste14